MARLGTRATPGGDRRALCKPAVCRRARACFRTSLPRAISPLRRPTRRSRASTSISDDLRRVRRRDRSTSHLSSTNAIAYARPDAWRGHRPAGSRALWICVAAPQGPAPQRRRRCAGAQLEDQDRRRQRLPADTLVGYGGSARTSVRRAWRSSAQVMRTASRTGSPIAAG